MSRKWKIVPIQNRHKHEYAILKVGRKWLWLRCTICQLSARERKVP